MIYNMIVIDCNKANCFNQGSLITTILALIYKATIVMVGVF